jgi:hypothetical protein
MDSFKTIPEKPDRNMKNTAGKLMFSNTPKGDAAFNAAMEEYEKYAPLKKRYNAAKKRYNELLPQLEEEDAATTQTLTAPPAWNSLTPAQQSKIRAGGGTQEGFESWAQSQRGR